MAKASKKKAGKTPAKRNPESYEKIKSAARARVTKMSAEGRDIGSIPPCKNPELRDSCRLDFRAFAERYFPHTFSMKFSADHLLAISKIETSVLTGGLYALAMPRGSGKTSLVEAACIWAIIYGHSSFVLLVGSESSSSVEMLESIKIEMECNDLLEADFPEVCYPIQRLDGIAHRCKGQTYLGARTHIGWGADELVFPTIPGSVASGSILRVAGITGRIRGMKHKRADGTSVRPSLVVVDDPQSDESAHSLSQCQTRERVLAGATLGLAGPGKKISGIMHCTVIRAGDLADSILDKVKHPEWNGERTKMLYAEPKNEALWDQYASIRAESYRRWGDIRDATEFYLENRTAMDEGAKISWEERKKDNEVSAIQHPMNLRLQDRQAFEAEYQNDPIQPSSKEELGVLDKNQLAGKLNGLKRGTFPSTVSRLTAFVDVQQKLLYYTVVAWSDDFNGFVVDYGAYPDPKKLYFTLNECKKSLQSEDPTSGIEGSIYTGLSKLTETLLSKDWVRDDGASIRIEKLLIDANWGTSTDVVYQFCKQSPFSASLMPAHGRYVGASSTPFCEYKKKTGDRVGWNWRIPSVTGKRSVRHLLFDTNFWKSFIHARFATSMGDKGCVSFWGKDPVVHQLMADHLLAEFRVKCEGRGRTVDEWKLKPSRFDNHWLDCLAGSAVAASLGGSALPEAGNIVKPKKVKKSLSEIQKEKMGLRR